MTGGEARVDVIVPVHNAQRPVARAVRSALLGAGDEVRVLVVCHRVPSAAIAEALGALSSDTRVELIECSDSARGPAAPMNAGLEASTAAFVFRLDSDDELQAGALHSMLAIQQRDDADVVIPMIVTDANGPLMSPRLRRGRTRDLDPVADRLAYRTHTFALVSRGRFGTLRLTPGLATGEDVEYSTAVWFSRARISADVGGPAYLLHAGAGDRVTETRRAVRDDLACVRLLLDSETFRTAGRRAQRAIATKLIRNHVISTLYNRLSSDQWAIDDRRELAEVIAKVMAAAPGASRPLSVVERRLLATLSDPMSPIDGAIEVASRPRRLHELYLTLDPFGLLAADAPIRMTASAKSLTRAVNARQESAPPRG